MSAAFALFRNRGYSETSMAQIAKKAGVSPANIYVYFESKLELLFQIYSPWLQERLQRLEEEVSSLDDPETRLRLILRTLWEDIPAEENGFANNLMQALSTAQPGEGYKRDLLMQLEDQVSRMIQESLPAARADLAEEGRLAHILFMAFDGFAMNFKLRGASERIDELIDLMIALLLGRSAPQI
ncbi:MAG: TetR/AcrR family transcriptional regulator [Rhodovibrionaceae bacterium]